MTQIAQMRFAFLVSADSVLCGDGTRVFNAA